MEGDSIEPFGIRGGTIDYGRDYEYLIAAYYALHLSIDDKVIDFKLSTNNKDMGDFDDVVVELEFKNNDKRLLALQLKHHANDTKNLALASLASEKGDFSLFKYCEQFKIIRKTCGDKYGLDFSKFHFILFTNSPLGDFVIHEGKKQVEVDEWNIPKSDITIYIHDVCAGNDLVNTYQLKKKSIYKFRDAGDKLEAQFLKQFSLYTKQKHAKVVQEEIINDFHEIFKVCDKNIAMNYLLFFKYWCQGVYGYKDRSFKLTKSDVRTKIAELILTPYVMELKPKEPDQKSAMLVEVMKQFDVSIVRSTLNDDVFQIFENRIDVLSSCDLTRTLDSDPKLFDYLRKFGLISGKKQNFEDLSNKQILLILWYLNVAPLVLKVGVEQPWVLPALELSRYNRTKKGFVLVGHVFKEDFQQDWKIFESLSDLESTDEQLGKLLETFTFSLQDRHEISIKELASVSSECLKFISTKELLLTLDKPVLVGKEKEVLPKFYMKRLVPKIIFHPGFLDETEDLVVVSCNGTSKILKQVIKTNTIKIEQYLLVNENYAPKKYSLSYYRQFIKGSDNYDGRKFVLVADEHCTNEEFNQIVKKNPQKNCHHFRFIDKENVEWIQSTSNIKELKNYHKEQVLQTVQDDHIFDHFKQDINVLCGDPGMGKTVMANFLANECPPEFWTIKIDLNLHYKFFKQPNERKDLLDHLLASENEFTKRIFKLFRLQGRIVIIWDSFDEMPQEIVTAVLDTITSFKKMGFRQWITGRYHCRDVLEQTFQVFSLALLQLSDSEQKQYAYQRLKNELPPEVLEKIIGKMYENLEILSKCDYLNFAGVPLQVHMLTEIFLQEPQKYINDEIQIVTITDIYQRFLTGKFQTFYHKMNPDLNRYLTLQIQENYKKDRLTQYRTAALKSHLDQDEFDKLHLDCEELIKDIDEGKDNLGIIIRIDEDGRPIFAHKTYSEFLVASWLFDNIRKRKEMVKVLFSGSFVNVRLMFDVILAKNSKPHLALLYQNFDFFKECPNDFFLLKDTGGRNLLHLACSWGPRSPIITTTNGTMLEVTYREDSQQDTAYTETLTLLLKCNNPLELDGLFQWDSVTYSDQSECLLPIELIKKFDKLIKFKDVPTVCHYSILYGYQEIFNTVTDVPMLKYTDGSTLLHACARHNRVKHTTKILKHSKHRKAINNENSSSETALDIAARFGGLETMKLLLDIGAKLNGQSLVPLNEACRGSQLECCSELLKRGASRINGALINAVYGKCLEIIDLLLQVGADVNYQNKANGCTAVLCASTQKNSAMVKKLLENGADPKIKTKDGHNALDMALSLKLEDNAYEIIKYDKNIVNVCGTDGVLPLIKAISLNFDKIVDLLIKQGADLNRLQFPSAPLHEAVDQDNPKYVLSLLKAGASPNLVDLDDVMPLGYVKSLPVMSLLIENGADVKMASPNGMTPLHFASYYGRLEIVEKLVQSEVEINKRNSKNKTALHYAIEKNHQHVMAYLLQNGARLEDSNHLAMKAAMNNSTECFELLLRQGIDVNACDDNGRTLLHWVALTNHQEMVGMVADAGADLNASDHHGFTPLYLAALAGDSQVIQELIRRGVDVNYKNPLHIAATMGDLVIVTLLLQAGSDPNTKCSEGFTPLYKAGNKSEYHTIMTMVQHENLEKMNYQVNDNHRDCVRMLVEHGADVDAVMSNSLTALHVFVQHQQIELMEVLLESRAQLNCQDQYQRTPLHYCAITGFNSGAVLLVNHGANPNGCDVFGKTPLSWAVEHKNADLMELLINSGTDVNYVDAANPISTPLVAACLNSDLSTVDWLIQHGADVNQNSDVEKVVPISADDLIDLKKYNVDKYFVNLVSSMLRILEKKLTNISPLNLAVINNDEPIVDVLLKTGADVNKVEADGWNSFNFAWYCGKSLMPKLIRAGASTNVFLDERSTPLSMALATRNEELFQLLIDNGTDLNQAITSGLTILHISCTSDQFSTFTNRVLNAGANVNIPSATKDTPLHLSIMNNSTENTKLLLDKNCDVNCVNGQGFTPIYVATVCDNFQVVKLLFDKGADINMACENGFAPLHMAVTKGNAQIVDFLLDQDQICVNYKNSIGITPLAIACHQKFLPIVEKLCQKEALLEICDDTGKTPLFNAVAVHSKEIVEYLCHKGANVNAKLPDGTTPLHVACCQKQHTIAECLLKHGASPNEKDSNGVSILLSCLLDANDLDLVKLLHASGANIYERFPQGSTLLHPAATLTKLENLHYLIQNGVPIDVINQNGETCLDTACQYGNYEAARLLIDEGVDVNVVNKEGDGCLRHAIFVGSLDLVKLLVEKGANFDVPNFHGNTPFFLAAAVGNLEMVQFLCGKGASVDVVDEDGDLPLHDAARLGYLEVVKFLVENGANFKHKNKNGETPLDLAVCNNKNDVCVYLKSKLE